MANVYLVRQDTEHLYGEYVVSAVVVAESVHQARRLVEQAAQNRYTEDGAAIGFYPELSAVHKIGNNGNYGQGKVPVVCCIETSSRNVLPAGNYTPIRRFDGNSYDEGKNHARWQD